jgi:hypothetical protein
MLAGIESAGEAAEPKLGKAATKKTLYSDFIQTSRAARETDDAHRPAASPTLPNDRFSHNNRTLSQRLRVFQTDFEFGHRDRAIVPKACKLIAIEHRHGNFSHSAEAKTARIT